MDARIVNLRTRRKQKARDEKRKAAGIGLTPGLSLAARQRAEAERRLERDRLEGHRLDGNRLDGDSPAGDGRDSSRPDDEE